jgi:hypothetical protein
MSRHPHDQAMLDAGHALDQVNYLPRLCVSAVRKLCGGSFGCAAFDMAPLHRAVILAGTALWLNDVEDVPSVVDALLDQCIDKANDLDCPAFVADVAEINPVSHLAALLDAAVGAYVASRTLSYADECTRAQPQP